MAKSVSINGRFEHFLADLKESFWGDLEGRAKLALLRGASSRQVGRVVATLTGKTVSAQMVSNLTRDLDHGGRSFVRRP
jgi:transposase-like protein